MHALAVRSQIQSRTADISRRWDDAEKRDAWAVFLNKGHRAHIYRPGWGGSSLLIQRETSEYQGGKSVAGRTLHADLGFLFIFVLFCLCLFEAGSP